ncbi:MAG: radical SAM protein [Syntrophomonadaceae bacterium]
MPFREESFKSILNIRKTITPWFWDKYSVNPYNGCQFGCVYCDSRSSKYYLPVDFENDIVVKLNAAELLENRLKKARALLPDVVALGGTTDPYQPAESIYQTSRQCLEVLNRHHYPVHICTKSRLLLWDLDLLESIGSKTWCTVSVTLTTTRPNAARFLEPRAPSPEQRLEIIRLIKEKTSHVQTGILLMPVVPFLTDRAADLEDLVKQAVEAGADYVLFASGMTMRDSQALWFLNNLQRRFPQALPYYERLYEFVYDPEVYRGRYNPPSSYSSGIENLLQNLCDKHHIATRIKRYLPDDYRRENYRIAENLFAMAGRAQIVGQPWSKMFRTAHDIQKLKLSIKELNLAHLGKDLRRMDGSLMQLIEEMLAD